MFIAQRFQLDGMVNRTFNVLHPFLLVVDVGGCKEKSGSGKVRTLDNAAAAAVVCACAAAVVVAPKEGHQSEKSNVWELLLVAWSSPNVALGPSGDGGGGGASSST